MLDNDKSNLEMILDHKKSLFGAVSYDNFVCVIDLNISKKTYNVHKTLFLDPLYYTQRDTNPNSTFEPIFFWKKVLSNYS